MKKLNDIIIKDIEESYANGDTLNSISSRLKISKATVSYYINRAGLSRYKTTTKITKELLDSMQRDYDTGITLKEISRKYKVNINRLQELNRHSPAPLSGYEILKRRRHKIKEILVKYKGGKCEICGYDKCIVALDFHHLNPEEKDFGIAQSTSYKNMDLLKLEVNKCILVCANCHREIHAGLIKV